MQISPLHAMGKAAKQASRALARLSASEKNTLLHSIADNLLAEQNSILAANAQDCEAAMQAGLAPSLCARLVLDAKGLANLAADVRAIAALHDPVGEIIDGRDLPNGLALLRRRVPLGVVATIYEARPNVTVDVAALCLKTGNAAILRGGKETRNSNAVLVSCIQKALGKNKVPEETVQAITDPDRALVTALLHLDEYVDMLIPRGGAGLHALCREQSRIPVITGGIGVCHIVVAASADLEKSLDVIINAKAQRPSACNAVETLLLVRPIATTFLPLLAPRLAEAGIRIHASESAMPLLPPNTALPIQPGDYDKEWLGLDINIHVVETVEEALTHIQEHGTSHSDAILTENMQEAEHFIRSVDSAAVYVNASTRFTDGGQFGLGAEVAISTQKLHARGPMGLEALTTYKWIGYGQYTPRK